MFNEFFQQCFEDEKAKGFDEPPNTYQVYASVKFLKTICKAAYEFEQSRKRKPLEGDTYVYLDSVEDRAIVKTALLASEVAEAAEWALKGDISDKTEYTEYTKLGTLIPSLNPKPEGYASELADIIIRLGGQCVIANVDMDSEIKRKMEFNRTRPFKNGKQY